VPTNGFAIAALICSLVVGWIPYVGGLLGLIFGIIGLRQCNRTGDRGRGLAIAGIAIGAVGIVLWTLIFVAAFATSSGSGSNTSSPGQLGAISLVVGP
jgi:hypothetical protein